MELKDLDPIELRALVALTRLLVRLDGRFSDEERAELEQIAVAVDRERFWDAVETAGRELSDPEAIREAARGVRRQEARELLYATLFEMAASDTIQRGEADLLEWLRETWDLADE